MKAGIKIKNITKFIQFQPARVLEGFAQHVIRMRTDAEKKGETTKSLTAKVFGNSGYGKV